MWFAKQKPSCKRHLKIDTLILHSQTVPFWRSKSTRATSNDTKVDYIFKDQFTLRHNYTSHSHSHHVQMKNKIPAAHRHYFSCSQVLKYGYTNQIMLQNLGNFELWRIGRQSCSFPWVKSWEHKKCWNFESVAEVE